MPAVLGRLGRGYVELRLYRVLGTWYVGVLQTPLAPREIARAEMRSSVHNATPTLGVILPSLAEARDSPLPREMRGEAWQDRRSTCR